MALTKVTGSVIKDSVSLSGNVSVGGTLTYQDVTNVDALGIGTFRTGINVSGGQLDVGSNIKLGNAGVVTATTFSGAFSGNATSADTVDVSGAGNANTNFYVTLADQNGAARTIKIDDGLRFNASTNVLTAGTFSGSGANLTNLPAQATIANNADNRIITGGSGVNLNGEANFTFSGSKAVMKHAATTTVSDRGLMLQASSNLSAGDVLPGITLNPNTNVDRPRAGIAGVSNGGTSGMDLIFMTRYAADGSQLTSSDERFRITSDGRVYIGATSGGNADNDDLVISGSGKKGITICSTDGSETRLVFADGLSGTNAVVGQVLYDHSANRMDFYTSTNRRVSIDNSSRLMVGTTTRGQDDADNLTLDGSGQGTGRTGLTIRSATNTFGSIFFSDATSGAGQYDGVVAYDHSTQMMRFSTASTQRVFINSSGQLLVGTSSVTSLGSHTGAGNVCTFNHSGITLTQYGVTAGFYYDRLNFTNSQYFIVNASNTGVYLGNGATSWTGYSDERMKTNITELDGTKAYNHIKTARATSFKWNATGYPTDTKIGFIAQDWETNYPEVVNTSTETVDGVENPKGIQYTETVPVLMAALKEAIAKIETLETEVAALKSS